MNGFKILFSAFFFFPRLFSVLALLGVAVVRMVATFFGAKGKFRFFAEKSP